MNENLVDGILRMMEAYEQRYSMVRDLPPLVVPTWLPALCEAEGHDLDAEARRYGFDGYVVFG